MDIRGFFSNIKKKFSEVPFFEFEDPGAKNRIFGVLIVFAAMIVIASIVGAFKGNQKQNNALGVPTIVTAQAVDGRTAYITWNQVSDADGYEIYTADTLDGEYTFYAKVNASISKYVFYNLTVDQPLFIKIDATKENDIGQLSEAAVVTPTASLQIGISTYVTENDITVLLPYADGVSTYEVLRSVNGADFVSVFNGAMTIYSDTDVAENTTYQYKAVLHFPSSEVETAVSDAVTYKNPAKLSSSDDTTSEDTSSEDTASEDTASDITGVTSEEVLKASKQEKESGNAIRIVVGSDSTASLADISSYSTPATLSVDDLSIEESVLYAAETNTQFVSVAGESFAVKVAANDYAVEQAVMDYINELHEENDEYVVDYDSALQRAAEIRARELAVSFSHKRPDGSGLWTLLDGYEDYDTSLGENIISNVYSAKDIFSAWYNDASTRANLLDTEYDRIGVGVYYAGDSLGYFAVVLFAD